MITASGLELRAGPRLLLADASVRVGPGDRIGLVGRNGAGKTTLTKVLAGEALPAAGTVHRTGSVGYLPQDPRTGDLEVLTRDRILGARGLAEAAERMRQASERMADAAARDRAMRSYDAALLEFETRGGYAAEAEAASIAGRLGLPERGLADGAEHRAHRGVAGGGDGAVVEVDERHRAPGGKKPPERGLSRPAKPDQDRRGAR